MNALPRREIEATNQAPDAPLLRTLLLTDICDSTEFVEKIGDVATGQLFRQHDQLVLELQQRWRGRLIDRSDGLLLLFERPIDGLGFALDYMKALKSLGDAHHLPLQARAGLHVGEVLTWRNSVEAVQQGAKPLEVEGLAKPMAARLMTMARPSQILLSPVAEPLVHRASRELGERGDNLLWKSHGRWQFKGVPGAMEIHEVGEAGIAPLRAPRNGAKAWRDVPFWRRPKSLLAEAAVLGILAFGAWFFFKPEPAIALGARDWVVVGDMRNQTGDERLDESLQQAFRISLEQSRYVNVLSDLKARETLQRMQKPEGTALDRNIASEIALRDGARAVILPTVSEVGGRLRVSAEVVDPSTQATVYAETADGRGIGSALDSVDDVTGALREKLGEAMASIQRDSKPLPQVTTGNIDALKAYALGEEAFASGNYEQAGIFYRRATEIDPKFALAYVGGVKVANARGRASEGVENLNKAFANGQNLTTRDRAYLEAWRARMLEPGAEAEAWLSMAKQYPDDFRAITNSGYLLFVQARYGEAAVQAEKAARAQNPGHGHALLLLGDSKLALGQISEAKSTYAKAAEIAPGLKGVATTRLLNAQTADRDFSAAAKTLAKTPKDYERIPPPFVIGYMMARGQFKDANREARAYAKAQSEVPSWSLSNQAMIRSLGLSGFGGDDSKKIRENELIASLSNGAEGMVGPANDQVLAHLCSAYVGYRASEDRIGQAVVNHYRKRSKLVDAAEVRSLWMVVMARAALAQGNAHAAQRAIQSIDSAVLPYQGWVTLLDAQLAQGLEAQALNTAYKVAAARGQAFSEINCGWRLQPLNVADSVLANLTIAEIQQRRGNSRAAETAIKAFDADGPAAQLPVQLRARRRALPTFN